MDQVTPDPEQPVAGAKAPVGTGVSLLLALLLALSLVALGVLLIQDALVRSGMLEQTSWSRNLVEAADGIYRAGWMWPAFAVLVVLGLVMAAMAAMAVMALVALKPRPRCGLALDAATGVDLGEPDLSRMVDNHLAGVEGVTDVTSWATGSNLRVVATTLAPESDNETLEAELRTRVDTLLAALPSPPRVEVSIHNQEIR